MIDAMLLAPPARPAQAPAVPADHVERCVELALRTLEHGDGERREPLLDGTSIAGLAARQVASGGGRIRPGLAWAGWAYAAAPGTTEPADLVRLGAALELLHTFALVHDDVMDESPTRRGIPTTHVTVAAAHRAHGGVGDPQRFAESVAVLVGDLLHAHALVLAAPLPAPVHARFAEMVLELVDGQAQDVLAAAAGPGDLDRAREVALLKTGRYSVQRPLELGGTLGGASPEVLRELSRYGELVGEAFALRDDALGVWGDPERTGKPVGDDLRDRKQTMMLALARDLLPPAGLALLDTDSGRALATDEVAELTAHLEAVGLRQAVAQRVEHLIGEAVEVLDPARAEAAGGHLETVAHEIAGSMP